MYGATLHTEGEEAMTLSCTFRGMIEIGRSQLGVQSQGQGGADLKYECKMK